MVEFFISKGYDVVTDYIVNDIKDNKVYFPDLVFDKFIIEVYGDFWHGNPTKYNLNDLIIGEVTVSKKHDMDKHRINRIESITKKPVFIWWENDILTMGLDSLYSELTTKINENN